MVWWWIDGLMVHQNVLQPPTGDRGTPLSVAVPCSARSSLVCPRTWWQERQAVTMRWQFTPCGRWSRSWGEVEMVAGLGSHPGLERWFFPSSICNCTIVGETWARISKRFDFTNRSCSAKVVGVDFGICDTILKFLAHLLQLGFKPMQIRQGLLRTNLWKPELV